MDKVPGDASAQVDLKTLKTEKSREKRPHVPHVFDVFSVGLVGLPPKLWWQGRLAREITGMV